jgi:hypothetical protein
MDRRNMTGAARLPRPLAVVAGIAILGAFIAGFGAVVMLLWNALLTPLFGVPAIGWLQGAGILALARILCGGIGGGRGVAAALHRGNMHQNPLREKWVHMTDEERKEFIAKMHRGRGGFEGFSGGGAEEK